MVCTPSAASRFATSADWAWASDLTLAYSRGASTDARPRPPRAAAARPETAPCAGAPPAGSLPTRMPRSSAPYTTDIVVDVAMRVLEGTQSVSTQAPPRPSLSTTVTGAPSCAATRAASYPPGPPPRMTILACGWFTLPHSSRPPGYGAPRPPAGAPALRSARFAPPGRRPRLPAGQPDFRVGGD